MKSQKELKEKYMKEIETIWPEDSMRNFLRKQCAYVVELSNGNIICLEKPSIKKDFCFGMGWYGSYTNEEFEAAEDLANIAKTKEEYFISENMKPLDNEIAALEKALQGKKECYTYINYTGQPSDSDLMTYESVYIGRNPEYSPERWKGLEALKKLDSCDIQAIIDGLNAVKKQFNKRLNTYLKKYGLTKLNVWTYCRD